MPVGHIRGFADIVFRIKQGLLDPAPLVTEGPFAAATPAAGQRAVAVRKWQFPSAHPHRLQLAAVVEIRSAARGVWRGLGKKVPGPQDEPIVAQSHCGPVADP